MHVVLWCRRQIGPNQRAETRYAAGYIIVISLGCITPISMSARQNTYQHTPDRMVHSRSHGKFTIKRSGRTKVGFHGRILCRFIDFSDLSSLDTDLHSIGIFSYHAQPMVLNAWVSVRENNRCQISRHFRSAWWSDFGRFFGLPQFWCRPHSVGPRHHLTRLCRAATL